MHTSKTEISICSAEPICLTFTDFNPKMFKTESAGAGLATARALPPDPYPRNTSSTMKPKFELQQYYDRLSRDTCKIFTQECSRSVLLQDLMFQEQGQFPSFGLHFNIEY